ncbi:hypothetical protein JKP27_17705 [Vibrio vulnificus]|nr:hypothetical protein [Vibrio vulnificus]
MGKQHKGDKALINVLKRRLRTCLISKQWLTLFEINADKQEKLIARAIKPGMIA